MAGAAKGDAKKPKWLLAYHDPVASLSVRPQCMNLCDATGDGDWRLIAACSDKKMRVIKGTALSTTAALLDEPAAMATFYPDERTPRLPSVAVAAGSYVFIYRNMRPYFKFALPAMPVNPAEGGVWTRLREGSMDATAAKAELAQLRDAGTALTVPSVQLLASPEGGEAAVLEELGTKNLTRHTVVTCLASIHTSKAGMYEMSQLVIGTEAAEVLFLQPEGSKVDQRVAVPAVPFMLACYGTYQVDSRVAVACRDGNVYLLKQQKLTSSVCECDTQVVAVVLLPSVVFVGTMDETLHCFDYRGRKQWSLALPSAITAMARMEMTGGVSVAAAAVALADGDIRVYSTSKQLLMSTKESAPAKSPPPAPATPRVSPPGGAAAEPRPPVNPFDGAAADVAPSDHVASPELHRLIPLEVEVSDPVASMAFGRFGREDNCLVTVHESGALTVRILPRRVSLHEPPPSGPPPEQDIPLAVPRKTRLFLNFAEREKKDPAGMHAQFMKDLMRSRLTSARSYVRCITRGRGPSTQIAGASLSMSVDVQGVGPTLRVCVKLQNTGRRTLSDTQLALFEEQSPAEAAPATRLYAVTPTLQHVPVLVPQLAYIFEFSVHCLSDLAVAAGGHLGACLIRSADSMPVLSARVAMPASQPLQPSM